MPTIFFMLVIFEKIHVRLWRWNLFFLFACNMLKYWFIVICFLLPVISLSFPLFSFLLDINKQGKTEKYKCCDLKNKLCNAYFILFYSVHLSSEVFPPKRVFQISLENMRRYLTQFWTCQSWLTNTFIFVQLKSNYCKA